MNKPVKTAQDIQDDIFRKMSADEKLKVWAGLWLLVKSLVGNKINYGTNRSKVASGERRENFWWAENSLSGNRWNGGFGLGEAGYIDEDVANEMVRGGGEFNFIDVVTGVKVDFWVASNGEFDFSRFKRRTTKEILEQKIYFTSPEDLILSKLKWFKESRSNRHLEDAESIMKISGENLDMRYLELWAVRLEVEDGLKKLRSMLR